MFHTDFCGYLAFYRWFLKKVQFWFYRFYHYNFFSLCWPKNPKKLFLLFHNIIISPMFLSSPKVLCREQFVPEFGSLDSLQFLLTLLMGMKFWQLMESQRYVKVKTEENPGSNLQICREIVPLGISSSSIVQVMEAACDPPHAVVEKKANVMNHFLLCRQGCFLWKTRTGEQIYLALSICDDNH